MSRLPGALIIIADVACATTLQALGKLSGGAVLMLIVVGVFGMFVAADGG